MAGRTTFLNGASFAIRVNTSLQPDVANDVPTPKSQSHEPEQQQQRQRHPTLRILRLPRSEGEDDQPDAALEADV